MGIRFKADHLTCPACNAAITPLNRLHADHHRVTDTLAAQYPGWQPEQPACETCITASYQRLTQTGLIGRLRDRLTGQIENPSVHKYRTSELV